MLFVKCGCNTYCLVVLYLSHVMQSNGLQCVFFFFCKLTVGSESITSVFADP